MPDYDVITIGGGLAGGALAKTIAEAGFRVLVLERLLVFRDRVRGEALYPWGVAEASTLGLYRLLLDTCAHETRFWSMYSFSMLSHQRDLTRSGPHRAGALTFYHPEMQEAISAAAAAAGAEVRRGVEVIEVTPGNPVTVHAVANGEVKTFRTRLVVGADGRNSKVRRWGRFRVQSDPQRLVITGVLLKGMSIAEDSLYFVGNPPIGHTAIFPLGRQRFRVYCVKTGAPNERPDLHEFINACLETGTPAEWFTNVEVAGPIASFNCADTWVTHPYRDGIALIGDAAAATDPSWGCGLSLTLRDVRRLSDHLLAKDDWQTAAGAYAIEHDDDYDALHRLQDWMTELLYGIGDDADARRHFVLPYLAREPGRAPDLVGRGPECPHDEAARRRLFIED